MARKRYDADNDGDYCGVVGGELAQAGQCAGCDGQDYDFSGVNEIGSGGLNGSEYDYLGHFRRAEFLCQGHNDIDATGKINNADDQNSYVGATEQGVAPGSSASSVGQFASISGMGNPL